MLATGTTLKAVTLVADDETGPDVEVVAVLSLLNPELTFDGEKITRARGSWVADGFVVGDRMTINGHDGQQRSVPHRRPHGDRMTLDPR